MLLLVVEEERGKQCPIKKKLKKKMKKKKKMKYSPFFLPFSTPKNSPPLSSPPTPPFFSPFSPPSFLSTHPPNKHTHTKKKSSICANWFKKTQPFLCKVGRKFLIYKRNGWAAAPPRHVDLVLSGYPPQQHQSLGSFPPQQSPFYQQSPTYSQQPPSPYQHSLYAPPQQQSPSQYSQQQPPSPYQQQPPSPYQQQPPSPYHYQQQSPSPYQQPRFAYPQQQSPSHYPQQQPPSPYQQQPPSPYQQQPPSTSTSPSTLSSPSSSASSSPSSSTFGSTHNTPSTFGSPSHSNTSSSPSSSSPFIGSTPTSLSSPSPASSSSSQASEIGWETSNITPPSRCFKRSPQLPFREATRALLLGLPEVPPGRVDLFIADEDDVDALISRCERALSQMEQFGSAEVKQMVGLLERDEALAILAYTCESPYPVYRWLNAWLVQNRRDPLVQSKVGPFFRLLYQGLEKLPQKVVKAGRGVLVYDIPVLRNCFNSPPLVGSEISFWGVSSFSVEDSVASGFGGAAGEDAIFYTCGRLHCVLLGEFSLNPREAEVLPLPPAVFKVNSTFQVNAKKLVISLDHEQATHSAVSYVPPKK